jgi:hypothetical protein
MEKDPLKLNFLKDNAARVESLARRAVDRIEIDPYQAYIEFAGNTDPDALPIITIKSSNNEVEIVKAKIDIQYLWIYACTMSQYDTLTTLFDVYGINGLEVTDNLYLPVLKYASASRQSSKQDINGINISLSHSKLTNLQHFNSADLYKIQKDDGQIKKRLTILFLDDKLSDIDFRLSVSNDSLLVKASSLLAAKDTIAINGLLSSAVDDQTLNYVISSIRSNYSESKIFAEVEAILNVVRSRAIALRDDSTPEQLGMNQPDSDDLAELEVIMGL